MPGGSQTSTYLRDVVAKVQLIRMNGNRYLGVLNKEENQIENMTEFENLHIWLKAVNIERARTLSMSSAASYSVEDLDLDDRHELEQLLTQMLHAKKYFREYMENEVFDNLRKEA